MDTTLDPQVPDQRYAMDSKLFVVFYMKAVQQGFKSEQAGRPIFDDVPHIKIYVPGDKSTVIDTPVEPQHKDRFPQQWEKFLRGLTQSPEGTPLDEWPQLTVSQVQEFKAVNVFTVEQLAEMADAHIQRFMGGNDIRRKAQTFLKIATDTAEAQRLAVENAELKGNIAALSEQVKVLAVQVEALRDAKSAPPATGVAEAASGKTNRT